MSTLAVPDALAFVEPSLIVHAFAPLSGASGDRAASESYLRRLWDACERLEMTEARLPGVGTSFVWPDPGGSDRFAIRAARGTPDTGARRQAILFQRHDVIGVALALEDPGSSKDLEGWRELLGTWRDALAAEGGSAAIDPDGPVPDAILGETLTFLCGYDAPEATPDVLGSAVGQAVHRCGLQMWDAPYEPGGDLILWDGEGTGGRRVVAALAPAGDRDELSRLFWWDGERELAPMARYQVNAAKLRYEARVHELRKAALAAALTRVEQAVDGVLGADRELDTGSTASLPRVERQLIEAQADSAGLVIQVSYLRELQRTVEIAKHNMALVAPAPNTGAHDTMVDRDQAIADGLSQQISHDIGYAEAVMERARHATGLSSLRFQHAEQRVQRERARAVLFQTALLSALLVGLGAIATFDLTLKVGRSLRLPLLVSLVTLLFAAPIVAGSWHDGFRPADRIVVGLLGASLGWLAVVAAWSAAPWFAIVAGVGVGAAVSQILAARRTWRRDPRTG